MCERVLRRDLQIRYVATGDQLADIFSKSLPSSRFLWLRSKPMVSLNPLVLRGDESRITKVEETKQSKVEETEQN